MMFAGLIIAMDDAALVPPPGVHRRPATRDVHDAPRRLPAVDAHEFLEIDAAAEILHRVVEDALGTAARSRNTANPCSECVSGSCCWTSRSKRSRCLSVPTRSGSSSFNRRRPAASMMWCAQVHGGPCRPPPILQSSVLLADLHRLGDLPPQPVR